MWSDIEEYRRIEPDYRRALAEFQDLKARYEAALSVAPSDKQTAALYADLQQRAAAIQALYEQLQELRRNLAATPTGF